MSETLTPDTAPYYGGHEAAPDPSIPVDIPLEAGNIMRQVEASATELGRDNLVGLSAQNNDRRYLVVDQFARVTREAELEKAGLPKLSMRGKILVGGRDKVVS